MAIETSNISIDSSISAELEKLQPMIEGYLNLMHGFYQSGLGKEEFFELARSELDDFDAKLDTISAKLEQEHGRLIVISDASLVDYVRGRFKFHPAIRLLEDNYTGGQYLPEPLSMMSLAFAAIS